MKEQKQVKEHEEMKEQEQVKEHEEVKEQVKEQEKVKKRSRATHQQQVKPPPDERSLPGKVFVFQQHSVILNKVREGCGKKTGKNVVFCQTPPGTPPPPVWHFFKKKISPHFFVENCIFNGRNEFYAWSHFKNK